LDPVLNFYKFFHNKYWAGSGLDPYVFCNRLDPDPD
jgi:hypothetical protein